MGVAIEWQSVGLLSFSRAASLENEEEEKKEKKEKKKEGVDVDVDVDVEWMKEIAEHVCFQGGGEGVLLEV